MPTIRINGVDYELNGKYRRTVENFEYVRELKQQNRDADLEAIYEYLIKEEKNAIPPIPDIKIEDIQDVKDRLDADYQNKYIDEYKKAFDKVGEIENSTVKKWGKTVSQLSEDVIKDEIYYTYAGGLGTEDMPKVIAFIQEDIKIYLRDGTLEPEKIDKLQKWCEQVKDVLQFSQKIEETKKEIEKEVGPMEDYVKSKMSTFDEDCKKDPEYIEAENRINQAKERLAQETERREQAINNSREAKFIQEKNTLVTYKENCKAVLKERENLAKEYYKTSLGSRIARWIPFIPRSWSKAGQIQDELDKIDKAIKDAGYEKKDIEEIKDKIKTDNFIAKYKNSKNQVEENNELNVSPDTLSLQQGIKNETVLTESKNDLSKAVDNKDKDLQKDEIVSQ